MSSSWTIDAGLGRPAYGDRAWHIPLWANIDAAEANAVLKGGLVTLPLSDRGPTDGSPPVSTSLFVRVAPCTARTPRGLRLAFAGAGSVPVAAAGTTYLYLDAAAALQTGGALPGTPEDIAVLAVVTTDATHVTNITDLRGSLDLFGRDLGGTFLPLRGGNLDDSAPAVVVVGTGVGLGTMWGATPSHKQGWYGHGPVARQAALTAAVGGTPTGTDATIVANNTARVNDIEARLKAYGFLPP